ncbi:hypothetical protein PsorP6_003596 [Peronosclerospora sorghi]|uniref:Uncharacterized protein n=1 Tax=Peronosclerospora sorghi TaxID=230839 RepID=A0ACC0VQG7_9STRA|nr:hypothetical protein PsorP6_003596 [Peronosclerospora sorghi]
MLKTFMPTTMSNLLTCCEKICLSVKNGIAEHDVQKQWEQMRICNFAQPTPKGKARQPSIIQDTQCTGAFTIIWSLTCSHKLQTLLATGAKIDLGDIHEHWHLTKKTALQPTASAKAKAELPNVFDRLTNTFSELPDFQQAATVYHLQCLSQQTPTVLRERPSAQQKGVQQKTIQSAVIHMDLNLLRMLWMLAANQSEGRLLVARTNKKAST